MNFSSNITWVWRAASAIFFLHPGGFFLFRCWTHASCIGMDSLYTNHLGFRHLVPAETLPNLAIKISYFFFPKTFRPFFYILSEVKKLMCMFFFFFLHLHVQLFQHHCWKAISLLLWLLLHHCHKSVWPHLLGSVLFCWSVSISLPVPHCLDYRSFIVSLNTEYSDSYHLVVFFSYLFKIF